MQATDRTVKEDPAVTEKDRPEAVTAGAPRDTYKEAAEARGERGRAETDGREDAEQAQSETDPNTAKHGETPDAYGEKADTPAAESGDHSGETVGMTDQKEQAEGPKEGAIDYAALMEEDLLALRREIPSLSGLGSVLELDDPTRYAALRELGLSPREAYYATARRADPPPPSYDNRSHLRPSVGKVAQGGATMTASELHAARALFGDLSDAALHSLYRRAIGESRN